MTASRVETLPFLQLHVVGKQVPFEESLVELGVLRESILTSKQLAELALSSTLVDGCWTDAAVC